jgi:hypothetical protein
MEFEDIVGLTAGVVRPRMIKHRVLLKVQRGDERAKSQTESKNGDNDKAAPFKHGIINALLLQPGKSISSMRRTMVRRKKTYCNGRPLLSNFTTVTTI